MANHESRTRDPEPAEGMTGLNRANVGKYTGPARADGAKQSQCAVTRSLRCGRRPPVEMTGDPGGSRGPRCAKQTQFAEAGAGRPSIRKRRAPNKANPERRGVDHGARLAWASRPTAPNKANLLAEVGVSGASGKGGRRFLGPGAPNKANCERP